jgi:hypothetical protein
VIASVVDKNRSHNRIQIIGVLVIYRHACIILEGLSNASLEKIEIELRKEESIQGGLSLLERI